MTARKIAAQLAAHTWYEECQAGQRSATEAARFARESWTAFLPVAPEGWGRLLIRIAKARSPQQRRPAGVKRPLKRELAVGG